VKKVAAQLLKTLKRGKLRIDHWRGKESSWDAVHTAILDIPNSDSSGLPVEKYTYKDIKARTEIVYDHVYQVHPTLSSPYFGRENN